MSDVSSESNFLSIVYKNEYVFAGLVLFFVLYASSIAPKLPKSFIKIMNHPIIKIVLFFVIALMTKHNPIVAIIVAIGMFVLLNILTKLKLEKMAPVTIFNGDQYEKCVGCNDKSAYTNFFNDKRGMKLLEIPQPTLMPIIEEEESPSIYNTVMQPIADILTSTNEISPIVSAGTVEETISSMTPKPTTEEQITEEHVVSEEQGSWYNWLIEGKESFLGTIFGKSENEMEETRKQSEKDYLPKMMNEIQEVDKDLISPDSCINDSYFKHQYEIGGSVYNDRNETTEIIGYSTGDYAIYI